MKNPFDLVAIGSAAIRVQQAQYRFDRSAEKLVAAEQEHASASAGLQQAKRDLSTAHETFKATDSLDQESAPQCVS